MPFPVCEYPLIREVAFIDRLGALATRETGDIDLRAAADHRQAKIQNTNRNIFQQPAIGSFVAGIKGRADRPGRNSVRCHGKRHRHGMRLAKIKHVQLDDGVKTFNRCL